MPVIKNSVVLPWSPQEAFDYLSDHRAELEWNPKCEAMVKLTEGPIEIGTRYRRSGRAARSSSLRRWPSTGRTAGR